jgi:hypothetical protein
MSVAVSAPSPTRANRQSGCAAGRRGVASGVVTAAMFHAAQVVTTFGSMTRSRRGPGLARLSRTTAAHGLF